MEPGVGRPSDEMPTTRWSLIVQAGGSDPEAADRAVSALCLMYRQPVYVFFRRLGADPDRAGDLTQRLFFDFLNRDQFSRANPEIGEFRPYLRSAAKHLFLKQLRESRPERQATVPLEFHTEDGERRMRAEPISHRTPEDEYDFQWAKTLVNATLEGLLRGYARGGEGTVVAKVLRYLAPSGIDPPYAALAAELGKSTGAVKMAVLRLRKAYRTHLRDRIAEYTVDEEVEKELAWLVKIAERGLGP